MATITIQNAIALTAVVDQFYSRCREFDKLVCTAGCAADGTYMPADDGEEALCRAHEGEERAKALIEVQKLGLTEVDFNDACEIRMMSQASNLR